MCPAVKKGKRIDEKFPPAKSEKGGRRGGGGRKKKLEAGCGG